MVLQAQYSNDVTVFGSLSSYQQLKVNAYHEVSYFEIVTLYYIPGVAKQSIAAAFFFLSKLLI
jgi:hypothetical protein